jgi:hypothetical protein
LRKSNGSSVDRYSHHVDCFLNGRPPMARIAAVEITGIRHAP